MHLTTYRPPASSASKVRKPKGEPTASDYVIGEINAYIAIRDELLAEAEEQKTVSKLDSLMIANDFVETCLEPSRPPYQAQSLPEKDAARERQRCQSIKRRAEGLRQQIDFR